MSADKSNLWAGRIKRKTGSLDAGRLVMAFFVISIHTSPLASVHPMADFILTGILARIAVPFFLMLTGYFILPDYIFGDSGDFRLLFRSIQKTGMVYVLASALYLPVCLYAGQFEGIGIYGIVRMVLFDGTFYHLWYLPAQILGMMILFLLSRRISGYGLMGVSVLLYGIGLFGDSYSGIATGVPIVGKIYAVFFQFFSYTRNGIFYAPVFLMMGAWFAHRRESGVSEIRVSREYQIWGTGFILSLAAMVAEGMLLHLCGGQRHDSMYISLLPCMFCLYGMILKTGTEDGSKRLRAVSAWIYVIHPMVIILVRGGAKVVHLEKILIDNHWIHFLLVSLLSLLLSVGLAGRTRRKKFPEGRAWIELSRKNLRHNVEFLQGRLPEGCQLMAAVKANAYGHGSVLIARECNACGVRAFCVASACEGKRLREKGIQGEILVLGFTHPDEFWMLRRYHLSQTVFDVSQAELLAAYGEKIRVHVKIDTGMHRLGVRSERVKEIRRIFSLENLIVDGIYTHLCVPDGRSPLDRECTRSQGQAFYGVVSQLKKEGFFPKIHIQASYGLLNYPELQGDYVRVGIALYGVLSSRADADQVKDQLAPVLSLKARVVMVGELHPGESAGYGMEYVAESERRIAVLSIGYADGLPRSLSNGRGAAVLHGKKAPVIGKICMDMTLIDVTEIPDARQGDIGVIIGSSGGCEVSVYDLAEKDGTITNEILSRLGSRLVRIIR